MKRGILLIPAGRIPAPLVRRLRKKLPESFGIPVKVKPIGKPPKRAWDETRKQFDAIKIIERMLGKAPGGAWKMLMIIGEDLFIPVLTHVIGEAQLGGTAGVLSLHRLSIRLPEGEKARAVFHERALKEAIHELGHTFGIKHCRDFLCPMSVSADGWQVDRKTARLCGACESLLLELRGGNAETADANLKGG